MKPAADAVASRSDRARGWSVHLLTASGVLVAFQAVAEICREARRRGIVTLVDGSQALPHRPVDIPSLGCDFYAFTGHKMLGPTGTGGLWARRQHLREMPPFIGGGEMISSVSSAGVSRLSSSGVCSLRS